MPTRRFDTCFISAPHGVDTRPLRLALQERNITWLDATSVTLGAPMLYSIEAAIARADFVCAVLSSELSTQNVLFEIGVAHGKGRPLLLIADPLVEVPSVLESLTYARISLLDRDALSLHLDAFLAHASSPRRERQARSEPQLRPVDVRWAAAELSQIESGTQASGMRLECAMAELLRESGAVVSTASFDKQHEADMALWIDELEGPLGNPLLVEVKQDLSSDDEWQRAVDQFRGCLVKARARTGLLIHLRPNWSERRQPTGSPLVITFSADEILHLLADGRLAEALLSRRNHAIHGGRWSWPGYPSGE